MFDDRLRNLRTARGLSQQQIADDLGLKLNTYRNYENDEREPTSMTLLNIARYFGVTLDYLLDYVTPEDNTPYIMHDNTKALITDVIRAELEKALLELKKEEVKELLLFARFLQYKRDHPL